MTNQPDDGCAPLPDPASSAKFDDVRQRDVSRDQLLAHYDHTPERLASVLPQKFRRSEVLYSSTPSSEPGNVFLRDLHLEKKSRSKRGAEGRSKRGAEGSKMEPQPSSHSQDLFAIPDFFSGENNIPCGASYDQEKSNIASANNKVANSKVANPPPEITPQPVSPKLTLRPSSVPLVPTRRYDVPYNYRYLIPVPELDMMCSIQPPDSPRSVEEAHFPQNDLNRREGRESDSWNEDDDVTTNICDVIDQDSVIQVVKEALELLEVFRVQLEQMEKSREFSELVEIALQVEQIIFNLVNKDIITTEIVDADSAAILDRVKSIEENITSVRECIAEESDDEFLEDLEDSLKVAKYELSEVKCDLLRLKITNVIEHGLAITAVSC